MLKKQVNWICIPCAKRASEKNKTNLCSLSSVFHMGTCDICGKFSTVIKISSLTVKEK